MAYEGFKKLKAMLSQKNVQSPGAVAASIARKKYGKEAVQKHAANGTSMKTTKRLHKGNK